MNNKSKNYEKNSTFVKSNSFNHLPYEYSVLQAQNNPTICAGGSATITATEGNAYLWSTSETTASISVSPAATTQYKVTVTETDTTIIDSMTVTVAPKPISEYKREKFNFCWEYRYNYCIRLEMHTCGAPRKQRSYIVVAPESSTTYT